MSEILIHWISGAGLFAIGFVIGFSWCHKLLDEAIADLHEAIRKYKMVNDVLTAVRRERKI